MRRVQVVGVSGAGKSTAARAIAARIRADYIELDALHHGPNWTESTPEELTAKLAPIVARDAWVVDGNYFRVVGDLVLARADTVVWLDLALPRAIARLLRRTLVRITTREELWSGNRETWSGAFSTNPGALFPYAVRRHFANRRELPAMFARHPHLRVVHLRTPRKVRRFLSALPGRPTAELYGGQG